jgi:hypothetical protein
MIFVGMAIQKFEDIIAWQKAQELAVVIYNIFRSQKILPLKTKFVGP